MSGSPVRIVIVGGVAGGASAAARARRCNERAEIVLLERDSDVSFGNCGMPYYIGGEIQSRSKLLVATADLLRRRFRIDVRTMSEALRIDRDQRSLQVLDHAQSAEYSLTWDRLILCPGARPLREKIPGAAADGVFTLRALADMDRIHAAINAQPPASVIVVGGGFIGLEMAEQLAKKGLRLHSRHQLQKET